MTHIVLSAYRCDPFGVSEAYASFMTAALLAEQTRVLLCTPSYNLPSVNRWVSRQADAGVRRNLRVLSVRMPDVDGRLGGVGTGVKPGFFLYDRLLHAMLRRSVHLRDASVVWHRSPMSYRFRSSLFSLRVPFVAGPIGGGLKPPPILADYFRNEGSLYRLRRFDDLLLSSDFWMEPLDRARVLLVTCDYVRDLLPAHLATKAVTVLDTGVDARETPPSRAQSDPLTVLFVGRLARYKAPSLAVESFARFLTAWEKQGRRARLVVVGDGPERGPCISLARHFGITDRVKFTGALARRDVDAHYEAADLFLFPSITEASGNVYLEAMRAGLPMIVTANGGGEHIPCDEAAIKIPVQRYPAMVEAFAQAMLQLANEPDRRLAMGAAGFRHVGENYSWPVLSKKLLAVIQQATSPM